jgi:hypothetical protein
VSAQKTYRALVACGMNGRAVFMATDSPGLAFDVEEIDNDLGDIGFDYPPGPGLWLALFTIDAPPPVRMRSEEGSEDVPIFHVDYRAVDTASFAGLAEWLTMTPPEPEEPQE